MSGRSQLKGVKKTRKSNVHRSQRDLPVMPWKKQEQAQKK